MLVHICALVTQPLVAERTEAVCKRRLRALGADLKEKPALFQNIQ